MALLLCTPTVYSNSIWYKGKHTQNPTWNWSLADASTNHWSFTSMSVQTHIPVISFMTPSRQLSQFSRKSSRCMKYHVHKNELNKHEATVILTFDLTALKPTQPYFETKWIFVPILKKIPDSVAEIPCSEERDGWNITLTFDHLNLISLVPVGQIMTASLTRKLNFWWVLLIAVRCHIFITFTLFLIGNCKPMLSFFRI